MQVMNRSIVSKLQYLSLAYKQRFRFGMAFRARAVVCVTVLCNPFAKIEVKKEKELRECQRRERLRER